MRTGGALLVLALACASCAATEETTPRGFVIAPSAPADGGALVTAATDAGASSAGK